jgi:hypothetical protein
MAQQQGDLGTLAAMIATATAASNTMQKQSTWVTGGTAAALALILTKVPATQLPVDPRSLAFATYYLFAALVLGVLSVPAHLFATVSGNTLPALKDLPAPPDVQTFRAEFRRAGAPWTRWIIDRALRDDGFYGPGRLAAILAQVHGHFLILQLVAIVIAAGILVVGASSSLHPLDCAT